MFVLTCPSCRHKVRVRYARKGATATCRSCHHLFKVEGGTVTSESGRDPVSAAPRRRAEPVEVEPILVLEEAAEEAVSPKEAPKPAARPVRPASPLVPLAQLLRKLKPGLPIILACTTAVVLGLYAMLTVGSPTPARGTLSRTETLTPLAVPKLSITESVATSDQTVIQEIAAPPAPAPATAKAVTPPPAAPRTVARAQVVALGEVYWSKLDPPAVPLTMQVGSSAAKGECYLERDRSGKGNGMIRGSYALSTGRVHRNSLLHVRLINPAGLSYAEFKRSLPVLTERQGVDLAMPVPGEWLAEMGTVLVELTPGEVVEDAVALEPVQWRFTVQNASEQLRVVTLSVRNTSDRPVRELHFGLDAVDEQGALVGSWHGKVEATIGPGKSIDFEAYVTTPHFITSDRLSLRAYGLPEPPPMDMGELMLQALKAYGLVSPSASSSPSP